MWKVIQAKLTGTSHKKDGRPCQDVVAYHLLEDTCIIVLADGAGSASFSEKGAEMSCESIIKFFKEEHKTLYEMNPSLVRMKIVHGIRTRLGMCASKQGISKQEFASTLLFVSINKDTFIAGHIGDGVIGGMFDDNSMVTISEPENGEYANTTFFTTSLNYKSHFRLYKGSIRQYKAFFLMSDGTAECLYDKKRDKFAPAITTFSNWTDIYDADRINAALQENMNKLFPSHTSDDCSFIMCQIIK